MKVTTIRTIFAAIAVVFSINLGSSQNLENIKRAFVTKDASLMISELASHVEWCMEEEVDFLSKQETVNHINQFISQVNPTAFSSKYQGGRDTDVKYYIGKLNTEKGDYQVLLYYKKDEGSYKIDEIRIKK